VAIAGGLGPAVLQGIRRLRPEVIINAEFAAGYYAVGVILPASPDKSLLLRPAHPAAP
jgi:hypothetical protein